MASMTEAREDTLRITAAGLLPTYWCNARCDHCYELSSPERKGWMTLEATRGHLAALARLAVPAEGVHIGGGEPFGNYPLLLEIVRAARAAGLDGIGYVETNGYWATDEAIARERLAELREAGMQQISISADVFHQSWVAPACVSRLWTVAREVLGDEGVRARRWQFLKSPRDLRNCSAAEREEAYRTALATYSERMNGRAATALSHLVPRRPADALAGQACRRGLVESGHVHVDRHGHVFPGTCAGLRLGRTSAEMPLEAVLRSERGAIWHTLVEHGPHGLLPMAIDAGYAPLDEGYADKCHLCTDIRRYLFKAGGHADELGPAEVYVEA
jgi:hypothetical protein